MKTPTLPGLGSTIYLDQGVPEYTMHSSTANTQRKMIHVLFGLLLSSYLCSVMGAGFKRDHSQIDHFISNSDKGHFEKKKSTSENDSPSKILHLSKALPNNDAEYRENYLCKQGTDPSLLRPLDHYNGPLSSICGTNGNQNFSLNPIDLISGEAQTVQKKIKFIKQVIACNIDAISLLEEEIDSRLCSLPHKKLTNVLNHLRLNNELYVQNFSKVLPQKYIFSDLNSVISSTGKIEGDTIRMKIRDFIKKSKTQSLISERVYIYLTHLADKFVPPNLFNDIFEHFKSSESFSEIDLVLRMRPDFFLELREAFMHIVNFRLLRWFKEDMANNIDCSSVEGCLKKIVFMMVENNKCHITKFISKYGSHRELKQCLPDHFKISKPLQDGTYGKVHLVTHPKTKDKLYAMKVIPWDMVNPIFVENEIQLQSMIDHPNVLPLYVAMHDTDGTVSIINEYCPGGDILERMLQSPPKDYSVDELRLIAIQSLKGLRAIHEKGIVH